jgi:hypothetical protein
MGEVRNAYRILVGKTENKRPLGGLRVNGRIMLREMDVSEVGQSV